ncbi:MICAL-like protein 2a [Megalops cyprinoides]|uniref:MICAL-like protein 2a n=1 Tax=Megalops cyprinoides TaxID=118141 RepID=UPI001864504B|nr:MICAL-like protein 2a [Megalops cyprinoides]
MAAIKALEQWCKIQCDGYRDVTITNMTTSFRDGLAFCALIHKHRPDLINYASLSKENVYDNNNLAFRVAEDYLGIPALLDAEDMVALRIPDRLSILTYVSQYYNYFNGRSPSGGVGGVKRPAEGSKEEPSGKKNLPVTAKPLLHKPVTEKRSPPTIAVTTPFRPPPKAAAPADQKMVLVESSNKPGTLSSTCAVCKHHVHLVQRHLVDGRLYHRSCFKCCECSNVLLSGAYKAGPEPGTFVCIAHQSIQKGSKTTAAVTKSNSSPTSRPVSVLSTPIVVSAKPIEPPPAIKPWTPSAQKTQAARQRFFLSSPSTADPPLPSRGVVTAPETAALSREVQKGVDDKHRAGSSVTKKMAEGNTNNNNTSSYSDLKAADSRAGNRLSGDTSSWKYNHGTAGLKPLSHLQTTTNKEAPFLKTTNKESQSTISSHTKNLGTLETPADWRAKLKPVSNGQRLHLLIPPASPISVMMDWLRVQPLSFSPILTSPKDTLSSPQMTIFQFSTQTFLKFKRTTDYTNNPTFTSEKTNDESLSKPFLNVVTEGSLPPLPAVVPSSTSPGSPTHKQPQNGSGSLDYSSRSATSPELNLKGKSLYIPMEEILQELQGIEDHLNDLEKQGVEMEKRLRQCEAEGEEDTLDALMVDWFNLIQNKQVYMRRESELVYIAKTQVLEEQQPGVEEELRKLMDKPEHLKTTADKQQEEELMVKLIKIVNDRNAIVVVLDEDRLREEEEDQQLHQMMEKLGKKKDKSKKKSPIKKLFKRKSKKTP